MQASVAAPPAPPVAPVTAQSTGTARKSSPTSRVIDELQSRIDGLEGDLNETKETLRETKQKNQILKRRNDALVEQLSNAKHESDMSEALLKRKERRVEDLEQQLTEALSKADSLQFESENMKKRMATLRDKESAAVSECERLKVSYDAIVTAQSEYKRMMSGRVSELEQYIHEFLEERQRAMDANVDLLKRQEPEILASYKVVVKNTQRLEEMYAQKQQSVREALVTLATATKMHGQKTSIVMAECEDVLKQLNRNEEMMMRLKRGELEIDPEREVDEQLMIKEEEENIPEESGALITPDSSSHSVPTPIKIPQSTIPSSVPTPTAASFLSITSSLPSPPNAPSDTMDKQIQAAVAKGLSDDVQLNSAPASPMDERHARDSRSLDRKNARRKLRGFHERSESLTMPQGVPGTPTGHSRRESYGNGLGASKWGDKRSSGSFRNSHSRNRSSASAPRDFSGASPSDSKWPRGVQSQTDTRRFHLGKERRGRGRGRSSRRSSRILD